MKGILRSILIVGLIAMIATSGYYAFRTQDGYAAEANSHEKYMSFKPEVLSSPEVYLPGDSTFVPYINQDILDLKALNEDVIGWITIPHTGIDYPFVQASDNSFYLHKDLSGNKATAGTIFMDYSNSQDFTDTNTILYGHHMKNGSMFASLKRFADKDFFESNKKGTIFLLDKTYTVEFFAYLVIGTDDNVIYSIPDDSNSLLSYHSYIKENARQYRETHFTKDDKVVTLSTCAYEFNNARMVLLGRLSLSNSDEEI